MTPHGWLNRLALAFCLLCPFTTIPAIIILMTGRE